jgi:hypothetical protein
MRAGDPEWIQERDFVCDLISCRLPASVTNGMDMRFDPPDGELSRAELLAASFT